MYVWITLERLATYWVALGRLDDGAVVLGHLAAQDHSHASLLDERARALQTLDGHEGSTEAMARRAAMSREELVSYCLGLLSSDMANRNRRTVATTTSFPPRPVRQCSPTATPPDRTPVLRHPPIVACAPQPINDSIGSISPNPAGEGPGSFGEKLAGEIEIVSTARPTVSKGSGRKRHGDNERRRVRRRRREDGGPPGRS